MLLAVLLSAFVAGCTKKGGAEQGSSAGNGAATVAGRPGSSEVIKLRPPESAGAGNAAGSQAAGSVLQGNDRLLTLSGASDVYPNDYAVGPLEPAQPAGRATADVRSTIVSFFSALAQGTIDTKLVSPAWRDEITRLLDYPVSQKELPESVRVGLVSIEGEQAHAAVRLARGNGRATGEIYLENSNREWYISDIQVDLSQLMVPFERSGEYDPAQFVVKEQ